MVRTVSFYGILLLILCFMFNGILPAQEKVKFGKIDIEDMRMTRCPFDSAADAMILCDIGSSRYEYNDNKGFELIFERLIRVKFFSKQVLSRANFEIEYWYSGNDCEKVESLKGKTYNLVAGGIEETKLGDESIFDEIQDIHTKVKKISFPAVKEGSVWELKYTIRSPFIGNIRDWNFQKELPIRWSEYEVNIPEYFRFGRQATGYYPFVINKKESHPESVSFQEMTYSGNTQQGVNLHATPSHSSVDYMVYSEKYATQNVPGMKEEPFARTVDNYATKIRYELQSYKFPGGAIHERTSSWEVIVRDLDEDDDFGKQISKSGLVKHVVEEISKQDQTPFEKMVAAHTYIKSHFKWNGNNSLYPVENLKKSFNDHAGNSADLNLSLILLLRELDLDAVPVALSTLNHGFLLESQPTLRGLDYVLALVKIDSVEYLLDATSPGQPYSYIPSRCLNGSGLVISQGPVRWVKLLNSEKNSDLLFADYIIDSTGSIKGNLKVSKSGYLAIQDRDDYKSSGNEAFTKKLKENQKLWDVGEIRFENMDNPDQKFNIIYSMSSSEICQLNGDMIYLNVLTGQGQNSNPFNPEKRMYPVDFNCPYRDSYVYNYQIPPGYKVESLPETVKFSLPDQSASFKFIVSAKEDKVMVSSILNISKTIFITSEYENLREFFARIVAKHAQQIVLKKL